MRAVSKRLNSFAGASPRKQLLLRVAEDPERPGQVSPERLESWLSEISGKVVDGHRLEKEIDPQTGVAAFRLVRVS
jgi:hypothetical protein